MSLFPLEINLVLMVEDMDSFPELNCGWSWEENKLFEVALAVVDEQDPDRWELVAAIVGSKKTAKDVEKQYMILLDDLVFIESGKMDHQLSGDHQPQAFIQHDHTAQWTDEDNSLLLQLKISEKY